jgi:single-stranded DNA-binding protein
MRSINSRVFAPAASRSTEAGIARAMFRVAASGRREQEASFFTVIVWRDQAEHAAQSLSRGSRVVVVGRLQQRSWTAEDGSARSTVEVVPEEPGPTYGGRRRRPLGRRGARTGSTPGALAGSADRGRRGAFLVAIDQLCSAGSAFAVPLAVWAADALPAVESESASPGFGHRGLLGHGPYRLLPART